ncbi:hypothetical protein ACI6PO_15665 [Agrobacterium tumefaciens]
MKYLFDSVKLLPFEMRNPKTRKAVFREAGKIYTKVERDLTDRPGSIARLMEMAFKAGVAHAGEATSMDVATGSVSEKMHDIDVPSLSREVLHDFRRYLVGLRSDDTLPKLEDYALILEQGLNVRGRKQQDRWVGSDLKSDRFHSKKAVGPLVKLGLFENATFELSDGSFAEGVVTTEWGIELLLTGATAKNGNRQEGGSTTHRTYVALREHQPLPRPDGTITIWDLDSQLTAFILDHRVNGVGRPERFEGGVGIEDIAYIREAFEHPSFPKPVQIWSLYKPNPAMKTHLFDSLVKKLLDQGILLAKGEGQLLISEWGYELIRTGATTAPVERIKGKSSTYREYQAMIAPARASQTSRRGHIT